MVQYHLILMLAAPVYTQHALIVFVECNTTPQSCVDTAITIVLD